MTDVSYLQDILSDARKEIGRLEREHAETLKLLERRNEYIQQLESENVTWQAIANTHAKDLKSALQQLDLYRSMPKRW